MFGFAACTTVAMRNTARNKMRFMEAQIIPHPRAGGKENRTGLTMDKQDIQDMKKSYASWVSVFI